MIKPKFSETTVFSASFEPTPHAASCVRLQVRAELDVLDLSSSVASDIELVVSELTANAVEQRPTGLVRIDVFIFASAIFIKVCNRSTPQGLPAVPPDPHDSLAERGRGLGIVRALTDALWVESSADWTSVICRRQLA